MSKEGVSPSYIIGGRLAVTLIQTVMSDMSLLWIENLLIETQDTYDNYATITPQTGLPDLRIKQYGQTARSKCLVPDNTKPEAETSPGD